MKALLLIDFQNDFCPGGALAVPEGDEAVAAANRLIPVFDTVILTQDWHPAGHHSFASSYEDKEPYSTTELPYGTQVLWPDHCIQGTKGAEFHPDLDSTKADVIIRKGFRKEIDSYSAFYENDQTTRTGLAGYLRERGIKDLYVAGLATDFCVRWSVVDGIKEGFDMHVIEDAVRGIDLNDSVNEAWKQMKDHGARITRSDQIEK